MGKLVNCFFFSPLFCAYLFFLAKVALITSFAYYRKNLCFQFLISIFFFINFLKVILVVINFLLLLYLYEKKQQQQQQSGEN